MKVTLDTNVLISGTFWTGDSFRILDLIDRKKIICVLSEQIIEEYYKTAQSNEILEKMEKKRLIILSVAMRVISNATMVFPRKRIYEIHDDPDDNKILECAVAGEVDIIVTQDNHLLKLKEFEGITILSPHGFLKYIRQSHDYKRLRIW